MQTLPHIIAIMGNSNSGKTTLARELARLEGFERVSFSQPMKEYLAQCYGVDVEFLSSQEGKKTLIYPDAEPQHPFYGVTYGEAMIRKWEASRGDRPLDDPYIWLAHTHAEIDYLLGAGAKALIFDDVRNHREVTELAQRVKAGCPLVVVRLYRDGEVSRESDSQVSEYTRQLLDLRGSGHVRGWGARNPFLGESILGVLDAMSYCHGLPGHALSLFDGWQPVPYEPDGLYPGMACL